MKLIKTTIKNFQSLGTITIEHGDFVCLGGSSDLGKSAIIRAIRSLHRNTASPEDVRFGESKLKVEQEYDEGTIVGYERSKSVNNYYLNDQVFSKVGREVPDNIKERLLTDKLILDKDQELDLNFSTQFESPFLLTDSSSLVTKTISSLSGIHYIYAAIREATAQSQKLKTQAQILKSNVDRLEKFESFKVEADNLVTDINKLEKVKEIIESKKKDIEILKQYKDRLGRLKQIDTQECLFDFQKINIISGEIKSRNDGLNELKKLKGTFSKFKFIDFTGLNELNSTHEKLKVVFGNMETNKIGYNTLTGLLKTAKDNNYSINTIIADKIVFESEEKSIKSKIKVCTACGRVL